MSTIRIACRKCKKIIIGKIVQGTTGGHKVVCPECGEEDKIKFISEQKNTGANNE